MKQEILQKAIPLFLKHGIREMSNQNLVEAMGISTKTIYKYFKSKEGLLEEILYLYHGKQQELVKNLPSGITAACYFFDLWYIAVRREYDVNNKFFLELRYYYPELEKKVNSVVGKEFQKYFVRLIVKGIQEGSFQNDIMPEVAYVNVVTQYEAAARTDRYKKFRLSPVDVYLNTIAKSIRGMCTTKGMADLDKHIKTNYVDLKSTKFIKRQLVYA
jgi:AcrR family transcriptional regulator